ncbi:uncharacterized protein Z520_06868 [Fonsecaea multimorphosa CBS 102226]|uniref:Arrestin C-terminal-like domain-containing protein n=1 Tax=Fonsecaea multimorphosa CBS 102226 TaxID=1442371 RepID=A0A0D2IK77_9EURO|nr:uncharacterized protein Z520_06868 [Fonsecaea multimorphosa CBS 102226]KIX97416.1 hypothetical protein Z520_06868 [Fonsecaea multimorphosa CBS 102226]OAL23383.1 hypothetical protein AYO22_06433 [Fonsecaea multimorphosa]
MEGYKEITSAIEGRLFLSTQKVHEAQVGNGAYFQSRPVTLPTAESWLSPFANPINFSAKTKPDDPKIVQKVGGGGGGARESSRRLHLKSSSKRLPKYSEQDVECVASTRNDAFSVAFDLAEPVMYLEGFDFPHNLEHTSAVLRGVVRLEIVRETTMSRLSLDFQGVSQTIWPESWRARRLKKVYDESIVNHAWDFLDKDKTSRTFSPGVYNYNFELPLASSFPETIDLPLGKVFYYLTATAAESGRPSSSATFKQSVQLVRIPCMCSLELTEPYEVRGLLHGLGYNFSLAAKSCPVGGQMPLRMKITTQADRCWQQITVAMVEDVQYQTRNGLAYREQSRSKAILYTKRVKRDPLHQRAFRRISAVGENMAVSYASSTVIEKDVPRRRSRSMSVHEDSESNYLHETAVLQIPSCSRLQADTAYKCLYVRHYLLITISAFVEVSESSRKHFEIRVRMPIQILTCRWLDGSATLPKYSEDPEQLSLEGSPNLCRCTSGGSSRTRSPPGDRGDCL